MALNNFSGRLGFPSRTRLEARLAFPGADQGEDAEATPSPEAGRARASGQIVFYAGPVETARSGFADPARDGETAKELRARVNRTILKGREVQALALRESHAKLWDMDAGRSLGGASWLDRGHGPGPPEGELCRGHR